MGRNINYDDSTLRRGYRETFTNLIFLLFFSEEGVYLDDWNKSNIVPIHKKESKNLIKHHRPIILLPLFSKVFERVIFLTPCSITSFFFIYLGFLLRTLTLYRTAGKGEGIYLTQFYHFHPFYSHLGISQAITAESSPQHIGNSRNPSGQSDLENPIKIRCKTEHHKTF